MFSGGGEPPVAEVGLGRGDELFQVVRLESGPAGEQTVFGRSG